MKSFEGSFAVAIPVYNGGDLFKECLVAISSQTPVADRFICIDSSSSDASASRSKHFGFDVHTIPKAEFNHGATRNFAVQLCEHSDIVIFLTQDSIPLPGAFQSLLEVFSDPLVGAVCGRQIPHSDANPLAAHARLYNYPARSSVKSMDDIREFGIKSVFMSNSFSAYRISALRDVGGFPSGVILCEDMYVAAKLLKAGYKVGYCAESVTKHSHNYSAIEEFRRYFDIGVFHAMEPWIQKEFGTAGKEGARYLKSEFRYLMSGHKKWILKFLINNFAKFLGVKFGKHYIYLPHWLRLRCTMHKSFWS